MTTNINMEKINVLIGRVRLVGFITNDSGYGHYRKHLIDYRFVYRDVNSFALMILSVLDQGREDLV